MVAPFSKFYGNIWVCFCLNCKTLSQRFHFKANRENIDSSKKRYFFRNSSPFERWHVFMRQTVEILDVFNTLTLKQIFWKTETFFKKLKSTKIENASFPYKMPYQKPMLRQIEW